jgi:tRNA (guanine37-N1)-methyltransferase
MRVDVLTIFPEMFAGFLTHGVVGRALESGLVDIRTHDLRAYADGPRGQVDDATYGGGAGMVLKPEPVFRAVDDLAVAEHEPAVVLLCPTGRLLRQEQVSELARRKQVIVIAGRYEGVDDRVRTGLATHVISVGDYVLSGGEVPAMALVDAVARLVPGVVGDPESVRGDSFTDGLLDHPHYTRPEVFRGLRVPEVLLSGDHERIRRWRRSMALERTLQERPDLLDLAALDPAERELVRASCEEPSGDLSRDQRGGQHA